jgi:NADH:ubiquinone oxidoreductase subunit F (NADH-binding)/NADH:ubiquinone oxidoreductase subunit E
MTDHHGLLSDFPRARTWLLPALQAVQHHERWLSPEALIAVAEHLRIPRSEVYGVATHYPEFRLEAPGRRVVRVCTGPACRVRGGLDVLAALETAVGLVADGTTADGSITLERLDCAFNCAVAPVVDVDGEHVGRVARNDVGRLLGCAAKRTATSAQPTVGSGSARPTSGSSDHLRPSRSGREGGTAVIDRFKAIERAAQAGASTAPVILVAIGSCTLAVGAEEVEAALCREVGRHPGRLAVRPTGCGGTCWAAPAITIVRADGNGELVPHVRSEQLESLVEAVMAGRPLVAGSERAALVDFLSGQRRELTGRCGVVDPTDIGDAIRCGSYGILARVLAEGHPERVIEEVKAAKLQGRGGAYFPAAVKWEGARAAPGPDKYLIVNGEEGEPGIFKDRHLMEGDPHRLLEGALLAAYAAGALRIYLYVHGEAHLSAARLIRAVEDAQRWGLIGERVLGSSFSIEVEVRRGAGGFVLGEETALMESIEGRRAMPRAKPPFPVEAGLWGRPTVINNVETLFAVPLILERGAGWWTALGRGHGTKCFGVSGQVTRPGMVEAELGVTLRDLVLAMGGGVPGGEAVKAVVLGGPSGVLVPPRHLDEPLVPGGPVNPGTGGVVALGPSASVRDAVRTLLDFNTRESCGKCTPCREGTARLRDLLDGRGGIGGDDVPELCEVVRLASLCGLGQAAPLSILSALREFPGEVEAAGAPRVS